MTMKDKFQAFLNETKISQHIELASRKQEACSEIQSYMGISLQTWANINARLANNEKLELILNESGLNDIAWEAVNSEWLKRMSCNQSADIAMLYSQAFVVASRTYQSNQVLCGKDKSEATKSISNSKNQINPVSFKKWVKITEHIDIASERGLEKGHVLAQYEMNIADWAIVGEFWVDRMNENAMEYGSEYHDLSEKYRNLFISQESI